MSNGLARAGSAKRGLLGRLTAKIVAGGGALILFLMAAGAAHAQGESGGRRGESETCRTLSQVQFLGVDGHKLLLWGILFCIFGLCFGMTIYVRLKNLPVHRAMREISELIYETCKTYLDQAGQIPFSAVDIHRRGDHSLLRRAAALRSDSRGDDSVF